MEGNLVTIEGIDGAGKTTLANSLKKEFQDAKFTKEPTESKIGKTAINSLKETKPLTQLFLFLADHSNHLEQTIKPSLKNNKLTICDRYTGSRYAYQGAQGIEKKWIEQIHENWSIQPDLTILLDIDIEKAIKRTNPPFDKKTLKIIRNNYIEYIQNRKKQNKKTKIIDANQKPEKIKTKTTKAIKDILR